jgi:hypothetical protein
MSWMDTGSASASAPYSHSVDNSAEYQKDCHRSNPRSRAMKPA